MNLPRKSSSTCCSHTARTDTLPAEPDPLHILQILVTITPIWVISEDDEPLPPQPEQVKSISCPKMRSTMKKNHELGVSARWRLSGNADLYESIRSWISN